MNKGIRILFGMLFLFSFYHLIRDIATEFFATSHPLIDIGHREHSWCTPFCGVITVPLELFTLFAIPFVLRRNKSGVIGILILCTIPLWVLAWLLP